LRQTSIGLIDESRALHFFVEPQLTARLIDDTNDRTLLEAQRLGLIGQHGDCACGVFGCGDDGFGSVALEAGMDATYLLS